MGGHAAAAGEFLGSVAPAVSSETAPAAPLLEEPSAEQEASPAPAQEGWDNGTSLHAALQHWGVSFCRVHRVGYFCNRFSLVKCCRTGWGYGMCGNTVHSNRCGWRAGGAGVWHAGGWHAGGWRLDQLTEQDQPKVAPVDAFVEEPSAEQGAKPAPAQEGWDNDASLDAALQQWGVSFCRVHRVGYFCNGYSLVKCCRTGWGYGMCGSTVHSNRCGWRAGGAGVWHAGGWHAGGWRLDQVTMQNQPDDAPMSAVVEEPHAEQEAKPAPAQEAWDNDTSLDAALQQWG